MCGIAGVVSPSAGSDLREVVKRMAAELSHRGPDDQGDWVDMSCGVALAHRRLSIIDVTTQGHQPMHSASGRFVVVYNGEIYNFEEIRRELEAIDSAPAWRGHSDTEVLLAAIEAWGLDEALARFVGMFAIALWDRKTKSLFLARDRVGEKPLYFGNTSLGFVFASELKAIRAVCEDSLELDQRAVANFMQFGYIPAPRSIFRRIAKLRPGHVVRLDSCLTPGVPRPYWKLDSGGAKYQAEQIAVAEDDQLVDLLHSTLQTSVSQQMVSDVSLGAFLSGGVDSSTIVALMQARSARRVKTYTIGFNEKEFDEAPYARAVAQHLGTEHTELYVSANDAAAVIPDLPHIYDEPFSDSSQIPTVLVSRLTRQHVTVSLSGDGGDELFSGYPRYAIADRLWRLIDRIPRNLRTAVASMLRLVSAQAWDRLLTVLPAEKRKAINGRRVHRLARTLAADSLGEMYVRLVSQWQPEDELVLGQLALSKESHAWPVEGSAMAQMRRWDFDQYLPDDLLVKVDRASMSASLESRAPLLNHKVVELSYALPDRMLVRGGQGKWILRKVLDRYVPRELIDRPKAGFSVPLAQWLRGPLRDWAGDLLSESTLKQDGLLSAETVSACWLQHQSGTFDRSAYLWNILMFQSWLHSKSSTKRP